MDQQDIRTLRLLEEIEKNHSSSQRQLAKKLNISLGLANSFIKRLSSKGYFKITTIPKNRIGYILTPKGFAEKSRLTYEYIQFSYRFYKDTRRKLRLIFQEFEKNGVRRIAFYGAGDLAEIAYLSLQETSVELLGIIDDEKAGTHFFSYPILPVSEIESIQAEKILLTTDNPDNQNILKVKSNNVTKKKIVSI